jgi:hypothetical protein
MGMETGQVTTLKIRTSVSLLISWCSYRQFGDLEFVDGAKIVPETDKTASLKIRTKEMA